MFASIDVMAEFPHWLVIRRLLLATLLIGSSGCSPEPNKTEASLSLFAQLIVQPPIEIVPPPEGEPEDKVETRPDVTGKSKVELIPTPAGEPDPLMKRNLKLVDAPVDTGPINYNQWPAPSATLVITGQQHGYIEPCGCTGLENQKGGVARRSTFLKQLTEKGWPLVPVDAGNQVRRFGRQAEIKFQFTARAFREMGYQAVGFGPDDLRLGVGELIAVTTENEGDPLFVSSNVILIDPEFTLQHKIIQRGEMKIGITSILDPESIEVAAGDDIIVKPPIESARASLAAMNAESPNFRVLLFFGEEETGKQIVQEVPGFDLLIAAGGYGEPTYLATDIENSKTKMVLTGSKGMYAGLIALYPDQEMKYARVPLTHELADAPDMRKLMADYQQQLKDVGFSQLGLRPIPHPTGEKFVGSKKCGECHKTAYEIWEGTPHVDATESIVHPPEERGDVVRHFDPECISCHVTGWNAQGYYPYVSGYLDLESSVHLTGNGCENCHGPGSAHYAAEQDGSSVSDQRKQELRSAMQLTLENAREKCMECHDLDNSPDFHKEGAFADEYWPQVEHEGLD